jgi:DNA-binding response OmpR family regulator
MANLSLSSSALARLLTVSGSEADWILSSMDGSTTVRVRLAVSSVSGATLPIGRGVELDFARATVSANGRQVALTRMELRLLGALLEQAPEPATKAQLVARLWPSAKLTRETEGALAVWVCALRRRFAALGVTDAIRTVRTTGYGLGLSS